MMIFYVLVAIGFLGLYLMWRSHERWVDRAGQGVGMRTAAAAGIRAEGGHLEKKVECERFRLRG